MRGQAAKARSVDPDDEQTAPCRRRRATSEAQCSVVVTRPQAGENAADHAFTRRASSYRERMAFTIRPVEYFYTTVRDELGAGYRVLSELAALGINLLAFTAVPSGPSVAQFALFPNDPRKLLAAAGGAGLTLDGPYHALLVQGDDELGALAGVHRRLVDAGVDIFASSGVTDGRGAFGYVVYVREDQFERAVGALEL